MLCSIDRIVAEREGGAMRCSGFWYSDGLAAPRSLLIINCLDGRSMLRSSRKGSREISHKVDSFDPCVSKGHLNVSC